MPTLQKNQNRGTIVSDLYGYIPAVLKEYSAYWCIEYFVKHPVSGELTRRREKVQNYVTRYGVHEARKLLRIAVSRLNLKLSQGWTPFFTHEDGRLLQENLCAWKDVSMLVKVEASREIKDVTTIEKRYYISDENITNASYYNSLVRGHWSIENKLHWHLDVTFREDACRARTGNAPENLSAIRKIALQMIANCKDKLSLKKRQYKAALDAQYMLKILRI